MNMDLRSLSLTLTQDCNMRCPYCFCGEKRRDHMDLETAKKAVRWLLDNSRRSEVEITLFGGEPLLRMELIRDLVPWANAVANEQGRTIRWNMTTNGLMLDVPLIEELKDLGIWYMLSHDGLPCIQDTNRPLAGGAGSYTTLQRKIPNILAHNPRTMVRASVSPEHVHLFAATMMHLRGLGFRRLMSSPVYEGDWTESRIATYLEQITTLANWFIQGFKQGDPVTALKVLDDGLQDHLRPRRSRRQFGCGAGRTMVSVGVDGALYPCHRFDDFEEQGDWRKKQWAIGHIEEGVIRYDVLTWWFQRPRRYRAEEPVLHYCPASNILATGDPHGLPALDKAAQIHTRAEAARIHEELKNDRGYQHYIRRFTRQKEGNSCHRDGV